MADFDSTYNAIMVRPGLAKFMVVPHYIYLVMKLPRPNDVISIKGDLEVSYECDVESLAMAIESHQAVQQKEVLNNSKSLTEAEQFIPDPESSSSGLCPVEKVKKVSLGLSDNSKTIAVGIGMAGK